METLGQAVIEVGADTSKVEKDVTQGLNSASKSAAKPARSLGTKFTGLVGKVAKRGMQTAGLAAGAALGVSLAKGFGRLNAIDQAQAKLRGIGVTGRDLEGVMENVTASVTGTAFGLDEAAGAAAGALSSGVESGKELEGFLTLVGDAATQAGTDFNSMSQILTKVRGDGKLTGQTLQQLTNNQLFALPMLAKAYEVPQQEMRKMVSEGKVSASEFETILKDNIGGAAQESGKTFSGAVSNMQAAMGRLGAKLLTPAFEAAPSVIGKVTEALDKVGPYAEQAAEKLAEIGSSAVDKAIPVLEGIYAAVKPLLELAWDKISAGATALSSLGDLDFGSIDMSELGASIGSGIVTGIIAGLETLTSIGSVILEIMGQIDWMSLGMEAGLYTLQFAVGIVTGIINSFNDMALWQSLWENLPEILIAVLAIALAPARLIGGLAGIIAKIPFVGSFLARFPVWINEIGGRFVGFLGQMAKTFWEGFVQGLGKGPTGLVKTVINGIKNLPGAIRNWLKTLETRLGVWALNTFEAIAKGAGKAVSGVVKFMASLPGRILGAIGKMARLLFPKGAEAVTGLLNGLKSKLSGILNWLKDLGPKMIDKIAEAGEKFKTAGTELMSMLGDGIRAGIDKAVGAVKSAASKLKSFLPGSPVKEGPLRSWNNGGAGKRLMGLLTDGIREGGKKTAATMASVTSDIGRAANLGVDLQRGFTVGASGSSTALADTMASTVRGAIRAAEEEAEVQSPSKKTKAIGGFMGMGFVFGMDKTKKKVKKAATGLPKVALSSIDDFMKKRFKGKGNTYKKLVDYLLGGDKFTKEMRDRLGNKLTNQVRKLGRKLNKEFGKLQSAVKKRNDYAKEVASANAFDLNSFQTEDEWGFTQFKFKNIAAGVKNLASKAKTFGSLIKQMKKKGIPNALIQQVIGMGIDGGTLAARELLSASNAEIKQLKTDWKVLDNSLSNMGKIAAKELYDAGVRAQEGVVKGLLKEDSLNKAAKKLAKKLTKKLKKALGIKSPSVLMEREIGTDLGLGVGVGAIKGLDKIQDEVNQAVEGLIEPVDVAPVRMDHVGSLEPLKPPTPDTPSTLRATLDPTGANLSIDYDALAEAMARVQQRLVINGRQAGLLVQAGLTTIESQA